MSLEEFEHQVNSMPIVVDILLDRPDLLNTICKDNPYSQCMEIEVYSEPGVINIYSLVEIKDPRFVHPSMFQGFFTQH